MSDDILSYINNPSFNNDNSVTLGKIAKLTDNVLSNKFPQISKLVKYPIRKNQFQLYSNVLKNVLKHRRKIYEETNNPTVVEEKQRLEEFYDKANSLGQQQMKEYLLINQQKNHSIPEVIQRSLLTLRLYDKIPIVNKKLMAPYTNPKYWVKGKLKCLNARMLKNELKSTFNFENFKKLPQYKLLSSYIRNPSLLNSTLNKLSRENLALKNPKKLARKISYIINKDKMDFDGDSNGLLLGPSYVNSYKNWSTVPISYALNTNTKAGDKLGELLKKNNFVYNK